MKEVAIKDICQKDSSALKQKELFPEGKYPVFGASGIAGYLNTFNQEKEYIGIVKDGSGIGRVAFYPAESSLIGTMQYILPKEDYDIRYIGYCLQSLDLSKYKQGAAIPHIYFRDYGKRLVKVTDNKDEQRTIVTRLDAAFSHIDALKANAEKQLNEARKLFQAELTECMKPKEGWEEKMFGEVCSFVRGPFGGSLKKECFVSSGYAVYEQQNAIYNKFTFRYFIDEEKYNSMIRFSVSPGELIMSCSGTIGKVAIIPDGAQKGVINQALLKLSPKSILDKHYLKYFMESSFFEDLISQYSDGAAIKNIASVAILKNIIISIPPLSIQHAIVAHLDALSSNIRKLEELQQKTIAECDALKQAMLREVFE